jgi:hypothetical protein
MSDERFDRDLAQVLRDVAGEEAPMSLRYRLANVAEQAPISRRLWFAPPMRLSMAAVAAVAVIVLAILLMPRDTIGPTPSLSPEPTPSVTTSVGPTLTPAPSQQPTLAPTVAPTPAATPVPPSWTALEWSDPVVPFPYQPSVYSDMPGTAITIDDILEWQGAYVGVGSIDRDGACSEAGFFRSADGLQWEVTFRAASGEDRTPTMCPRFVVSVGDVLFALGQERIWQSNDGISWRELDPASLRGLWTSRGEELVDLAAGPGGMVVIGKVMNTFDSIVAFSADGRTWTRIELPASQSAIAWDATAFDGGFVIAGRDGQADGGGSPTEPYVHPGVGAPAAWFSPDGRTWTQASVEGTAVKGGALTRVVAGASGLFAIGNDIDLQAGYVGWSEGVASIVGAWASIDGLTWEKVGLLDSLVPGAASLESDGTNIVALRDGAAMWISTDGRLWWQASVGGDLLVPSYLFYPMSVHEASPLSMYDTKLWITVDGLLVSYQVDSPEGFAVKQLQLGRVIDP